MKEKEHKYRQNEENFKKQKALLTKKLTEAKEKLSNSEKDKDQFVERIDELTSKLRES